MNRQKILGNIFTIYLIFFALLTLCTAGGPFYAAIIHGLFTDAIGVWNEFRLYIYLSGLMFAWCFTILSWLLLRNISSYLALLIGAITGFSIYFYIVEQYRYAHVFVSCYGPDAWQCNWGKIEEILEAIAAINFGLLIPIIGLGSIIILEKFLEKTIDS